MEGRLRWRIDLPLKTLPCQCLIYSARLNYCDGSTWGAIQVLEFYRQRKYLKAWDLNLGEIVEKF